MSRVGSVRFAALFIPLMAIVLTAGGFWYHTIHQERILAAGISVATSSQAQPSRKPILFRNDLLGYDIQYARLWRVAVSYTSHLYLANQSRLAYAALGCSIDSAPTSAANLEQWLIACVGQKTKANPRFATKLSSIAFPGADNSDVVVLTDLSQIEESQFLAEVSSGTLSITDFPSGHSISIYPTDSAVPTSSFKQHVPNAKSPISTDLITLSNGLQAERVDTRAMSGGNLTVSLLHIFHYVLAGENVVANALVFETDANPSSSAESEFYRVVDSIAF